MNRKGIEGYGSYCSLCVRKFLSYKTQCPICCVPVTEPELRNNRILDEVVKCFRSARDLAKCNLESPPTSPQATRADGSDKNVLSSSKTHAKMKLETVIMDKFLSRSPSVTTMRPLGEQSMEKQCSVEETSTCAKPITAASNRLGDRRHRSTDVAEQPSTSREIVKVNCPVCAVAIPENNINKHLDGCLIREEKKESLRSSVNQRKLLPKLVYNLLSERDLRKKLKECGLSTQGNKAQMVKRHQTYVQIYNSQCDSLNPRPASEIAREIERNEKTQAQLESKASENIMKFTKDQSEDEIDAVHKEYRIKHRKEFQQLVAEVRNRWKTKGTKMKKDDKDVEEQCPTVSGEDVKECQDMDCSAEELHQDDPHLSESTGMLAAPTPLKDEHCSSDVVPASPLSIISSISDICSDPEYSQEFADLPNMELSNAKTQKRKTRGVPRKMRSENKRSKK
ncbi:E3 ubiquitin-protein ligase RAD18 isoform X2 [Stegostoma tigrinum]|uniref:E3 ubiquitin-protein ligase RAD18 isoform X2 n=1 Tax=Stegostoma tigrinum TaxID=3053191 RepID=UPI00287044ED|nr:E3 ubiquitin-protein ligase RAD18 isoform X2 [Stegostoma tigrinum]